MILRAAAAMGIAAVLFLLPIAAEAATRYDPRLRFSTISTRRFDIHFHQRLPVSVHYIRFIIIVQARSISFCKQNELCRTAFVYPGIPGRQSGEYPVLKAGAFPYERVFIGTRHSVLL